MTAAPQAKINRLRFRLLETYNRSTDKLMVGLALVWMGLLIADFVGEISRPLQILSNTIWALFAVDFAIKFAIAPKKTEFVRTHWLTLISLVVPALRAFRIVQALSALRALSLLRFLTSLNRTMGALAHTMGRRGVGYVVVVTLIVLFAGAAGMYQFEGPTQLIDQGYADIAKSGGGLPTYSDAVWWTAMLMTTIGSQYWPVTTAGRTLCFFISLYSLGVFGFITAALASFFIKPEKPAEAIDTVSGLREEIRSLRDELRRSRSE